MLQKTLEQIGFNNKEARIYVQLLSSGPVLIQQISDLTGIKRTTLYLILEQMISKGWLSIVIAGKRKKYQAEAPEKIAAYLKQKQLDFAHIAPALTGLTTKEVQFKPLIKFYQGKDGIKAIYEDSLAACQSGDEILAYGGLESIFSIMPQYTQSYIQRRAQKGILLRGIGQLTKEGDNLLKNDQQDLRISKLVPKDQFDIKIEKMIYKDRLVIASYQGYLSAILIQSKVLADAERATFELIWKGLEYKGDQKYYLSKIKNVPRGTF